jgi:branched-chain amino acid transport system substrate-binding protein
MRKAFHSLGKVLGCASLLVIFAGSAMAQQNSSPAPYASIAASGVSYAGPGRESSFDLKGPVIHIGILAPLKGPRKADGEAIVRAARMAIEDEGRKPLPGGLQLGLAVGDESGPAWGRVTDAVLRLVFSTHVVAIVTSANGSTAHLSEQVGNKIGVPILTLSTDATTTQINLPWIFRLAPSDAQQAQAIAQDVYRARGFERVLLVAERDHDGRMGGREFVEAARRLGAHGPATLAIDPLRPDAGALLAAIRKDSPQAIVFWTQPENARKLLEAIREKRIYAPIYLSQETAQAGSGLSFAPQSSAGVKDPSGAGIYTVDYRPEGTATRESFARRYQSATGAYPSPVATEAYDAVRLVAQCVRKAGPNRARLRDQILRAQGIAGVAGKFSFDSQGNNRADVCLVRFQ